MITEYVILQCCQQVSATVYFKHLKYLMLSSISQTGSHSQLQTVLNRKLQDWPEIVEISSAAYYCKKIKINKNQGWRQAEAFLCSPSGRLFFIFSFSHSTFSMTASFQDYGYLNHFFP